MFSARGATYQNSCDFNDFSENDENQENSENPEKLENWKVFSENLAPHCRTDILMENQ